MQIWCQRLIPQHFLSRLTGRLANCRVNWLKNFMIRWFIRRYGVNMEEAAPSDYTAYPDFNAFFTRPLRAGVRPMPEDPNAIVSPVDGFVSELGRIKNNQLLQAKGHHYDLGNLLGGDAAMAAHFTKGHFFTAYLSPKDYHRVHMPISGHLIKMIYVPGILFSVNPYTVSHIPSLFARNERMIALFETALGPMAVILVGAIIVASIATVWHGIVTPPIGSCIQQWDYADQTISFDRGEEMGHFQLGSTVILLFGANRLSWDLSLKSENSLQMGRLIGARV